MMNRIFLFLMAVVFSAPAFAQDRHKPVVCMVTSEYHASDDVNYEPGVDVHGNPVTQADLGMMPFEQADIVSVPLTVDLAQHIRDNPGEYEGVAMEANLGTLDIQMDGRIFFNGQDWTADIQEFCGNPEAWPDGQPLPDVIQSEPAAAAPASAPPQAVTPEPAPVIKEQAPSPQEPGKEPGKLLEGGESTEEGYR